MTSPKPLQRLYDLDKSSPRFRYQLRDIIDGKEYREQVPHLGDGDLARLVEYLDSVRLRIALPHFLSNAIVGSRLFRPYGSHVPDVLG